MKKEYKMFFKHIFQIFTFNNQFFSFSNQNLANNKKRVYKEYFGKYSAEICDEYVLEQKFYKNNLYKRIINKWTSQYHVSLNRYLRGFYIPSPEELKDFDRYHRILSLLINESSGLNENTLLFREKRM